VAFSQFFLDLGALPYAVLSRRTSWWNHCAAMVDRFPVIDGRPRVVLDLGCGPGISAQAFQATAPADVVVGLDLSQQMLRHATRADPEKKVGWLRGDALSLPIADASVDVVTGHSFLYLLPDRARALQEIARVLRPNGRLVLVEPRAQNIFADAWSLLRVLFRAGPAFALFMLGWRCAAAISGAFTERGLTALIGERVFEELAVENTIDGLGFLIVARRSAESCPPARPLLESGVGERALVLEPAFTLVDDEALSPVLLGADR
jgi:ubiquinone/menaquinone biosynthesis C-methylase UbiE